MRRLAAVVWAGPVSVLGVIAALLSGGRWRWDAPAGCVVVEGSHRGPMAILGAMGYRAITLGHVVVSRPSPIPPVLLAHEAAHVRQTERLGPLYPLIYLAQLAWYGYRDHPMERAARRAQVR